MTFQLLFTSSIIQNSRRFTTFKTIRFKILTVFIDLVHSILPTTVAALALAYLFPDSTLICRLDNQWQTYFNNKDSQPIRRIQDNQQCYGLKSARDRAWPFKDAKHGYDAWIVQLGHKQNYFGAWRREEKVASIMAFLAAA